MLFSRIIPSCLALVALILGGPVVWAADQTFRFEKADAQSVALVGEFNQWHAQPMARQADGSWRITIPLSPGTYGYKFFVDGKDWVFDLANPQRKTVDGIENSAVEVVESGVDASSALGSAAPAPSVAPLTTTVSTTPAASFAPTPGEESVTEIKLTPANRALAAREGDARLTTARFALVVPPGFDPSKSWPILVINNTENYGNVDAMHEFKEAAIGRAGSFWGRTRSSRRRARMVAGALPVPSPPWITSRRCGRGPANGRWSAAECRAGRRIRPSSPATW